MEEEQLVNRLSHGSSKKLFWSEIDKWFQFGRGTMRDKCALHSMQIVSSVIQRRKFAPSAERLTLKQDVCQLL